ncbi:hypothetical protein [Haloparvum sp. AD34]
MSSEHEEADGNEENSSKIADVLENIETAKDALDEAERRAESDSADLATKGLDVTTKLEEATKAARDASEDIREMVVAEVDA